MTNQELKPCPFCGSEEVVFQGCSSRNAYCTNCGASSGENYSEIEIANLWNRPNSELKARLERVIDEIDYSILCRLGNNKDEARGLQEALRQIKQEFADVLGDDDE